MGEYGRCTPNLCIPGRQQSKPTIWECRENTPTPQLRSLRGKSWFSHFPKQFQMASQTRERHNSCKMICIPASLTIPLFLLYTLWIPAWLVCLPRIAGIRNGIIRLYTSSSFMCCLHCFEVFFIWVKHLKGCRESKGKKTKHRQAQKKNIASRTQKVPMKLMAAGLC